MNPEAPRQAPGTAWYSAGMSGQHRSWVEAATGEPDPVIDAYKKDIDRTLLRANLARSIEERLHNLARLQRFGKELRRAGRTLR
jgi:hypothetical protein